MKDNKSNPFEVGFVSYILQIVSQESSDKVAVKEKSSDIILNYLREHDSLK